MNAKQSIVLNFNNAAPVKTGLIFKAGDKGITFDMDVRELDPTGMTPKIVFYRSNATSVESDDITETDGIFSYTTLGNEFAVPGVVVADLKFYDGDDQRVSTASFIFMVTADTLDGLGGGTAGYSDQLEQLSQEFSDTLEEYKDAFGDVGAINPRGAYSSSADYNVLDLVSYQGSSYLCRTACKNKLPTNTTYWQVFASGGGGGGTGDYDDLDNKPSINGTTLSGNKTTEDLGLFSGDYDDLSNKPALFSGDYDDLTNKPSIPSNFGDLADVNMAGVINGQVPAYNSTTGRYEPFTPSGGGGILPHVVVISDTGSTVTIVKGGRTITATETSTGHFEADVDSFGTWTIHSIFGGDETISSLNVDTVKIYTVDIGHFSASITVNFPNVGTCALSAPGISPVYATSSPYTFTVHEATTYTVTVTIDGVIKTDTVSISTDGQSESVTIEFGTITVNYHNDYRGETFTCVNGGTTISKAAPNNANTFNFYPPTTGTWEVTATYSQNANVISLATPVTLNFVTLNPSTFAEIHEVVQAGMAEQVFEIGDQIEVTYTATDNTQYAMPFDIVNFDTVEIEDGTTHPGMFLQSHYVTVEPMQFDAPEPNNADANIKQYGYNRWSESGLRAWLNSDAAVGGWWGNTFERGGNTVTRRAADVAPALLSTYNGFMKGLPADFIAILGNVKVQTKTNTVTDGGVTDVTYDKFFTPSLEQIYCTPESAASGIEGDYWEYWKDRLGINTPASRGSSYANYVTYTLESQSTSHSGLRSGSVSTSHQRWDINTSGTIVVYAANSNIRSAPACVIV